MSKPKHLLIAFCENGFYFHLEKCLSDSMMIRPKQISWIAVALSLGPGKCDVHCIYNFLAS